MTFRVPRAATFSLARTKAPAQTSTPCATRPSPSRSASSRRGNPVPQPTSSTCVHAGERHFFEQPELIEDQRRRAARASSLHAINIRRDLSRRRHGPHSAPSSHSAGPRAWSAGYLPPAARKSRRDRAPGASAWLCSPFRELRGRGVIPASVPVKIGAPRQPVVRQDFVNQMSQPWQASIVPCDGFVSPEITMTRSFVAKR